MPYTITNRQKWRSGGREWQSGTFASGGSDDFFSTGLKALAFCEITSRASAALATGGPSTWINSQTASTTEDDPGDVFVENEQDNTYHYIAMRGSR